MRVDVIGDSHVARLRDTPIAIDTEMYFWVQRGGRWTHLRDTLQRIAADSNRDRLRDVIVIFIGGNDLDTQEVNVSNLAALYGDLLNRAESISGAVMFMAAWPRPGSRYSVEYWTNVEYFEHLLKGRIGQKCQLWRWDRTLTFTERFFSHDGIHCHVRRYKKVVRYLMSAILAAMKRVRRNDE